MICSIKRTITKYALQNINSACCSKTLGSIMAQTYKSCFDIKRRIKTNCYHEFDKSLSSISFHKNKQCNPCNHIKNRAYFALNFLQIKILYQIIYDVFFCR